MPGHKHVHARLSAALCPAALCPAMTILRRLRTRRALLARGGDRRYFGSFSACSLRLAAQDVALSRRKQGFESPRERQRFQRFSGVKPAVLGIISNFSPMDVASEARPVQAGFPSTSRE